MLKTKITGVKKTKQITKAMNMVASAKLRGAQQRIERFRPYADKFYGMLTDLAGKADEGAHPLLEVRDEVKTVAILLCTSDRGLCGSFNANMINTALRLGKAKQAEGKKVLYYSVGKKGRDAVRRQGFELANVWADQMNAFDFTLANNVGMTLINAYLEGVVDEVTIVFGQFVSVARQEAITMQVLPIGAAAETGEAESGQSEYIYEPDVVGLLAELLPSFRQGSGVSRVARHLRQ